MRSVQVADGIHRLTQGVVNFYLVEDGAKLTMGEAGHLRPASPRRCR